MITSAREQRLRNAYHQEALKLGIAEGSLCGAMTTYFAVIQHLDRGEVEQAKSLIKSSLHDLELAWDLIMGNLDKYQGGAR